MLSLQMKCVFFFFLRDSLFSPFCLLLCYLFRPYLFSLWGILEFRRNTEFISYVRMSRAFHRKFQCRPSSTCECTPPRHRAWALYLFYLTVHRNSFLFNNQPDALIIPILFCYKTLHVSGIFSAHRQEFSTVYSALVSQSQDGSS